MWAWFQKHQHLILSLMAILAAFAAGAHVGKVTSPYYAAHPIVFSEPAASPADLGSLVITPTAAPQPLEASAASPQPTVAGATSAASEGSRFVGSVNSDLYHDPSCSSASRIKPANQIWFESQEAAEKAGYSPSACTKEKLGI